MSKRDTRPAARVALLGESQVGKSHYGAQLLLRLNTQACELRMRGAATNLSAYEEVVQRLNEGVPAAHTPAATYEESVWPVHDINGLALDLVWPDYAGEQVRRLIDERRVSADWRDRVQKADGWVLMIRPHLAVMDDDPFSRPLTHLRNKSAGESKGKQSSQARLVELLQMLLYARRVGASSDYGIPALTVMLSCWDELNDVKGLTPPEVLARLLPLVASFIATNWNPGHHRIVGVSALEQPLQADNPNESFINDGPESQGYVVMSDGTVSKDLTLPIAELARMVS
jgi:hypothetical protein